MKKLFNTIIPLTIIAVVGLSCGDGATPARAPSWHYVWAFLGTMSGVAEKEDDTTVYVVGSQGDTAIIYEYDVIRRTGEEFFRAPYAGSSLYSVKYGAGDIWAAGYKTVGGGQCPYVLRWDWDAPQEVTVPSSIVERSLNVVGAVANGGVWFTGNCGLYYYKDGAWDKRFGYNNVPKEIDTVSVAVTPNGVIYIYEYTGYHGGNAAPYLYTSRDEGRTWDKAKVTLADDYWLFGGELRYAEIAAAGEALYILTTFKSTYPDKKVEYYGVAALTGQDAGAFEIIFMAPYGPNFFDATYMAFRSETEGFVTGAETSVALTRGEWVLEETPHGEGFVLEVSCAGRNAYWALIGSGLYAAAGPGY